MAIKNVFEMHKIFSFKGITRGCDNLLASDGECIMAVNVRAKDGVMVPLPQPTEEAVLTSGYSKIFWHDMTRHYLCVTDDAQASLHLYDSSWNRVLDESGEPFAFDGLYGVNKVEFLGYVACCMCRSGIVYVIYRDGKYCLLGERPPLPELEITVTSKLSRIITEETFTSSATDGLETSWWYNSKGFFDEAIATLNEEGYYIDRALFKFALRAFDGSYIVISPAMYVSDEGRINGISRDGFNLIATKNDSNASSTYDVGVLGFKPSFAFSQINLTDWKNIVMGIDIFTTGSIMGKKIKTQRWSSRSSSSNDSYTEYEVYDTKDIDELYSDIADASHYYKIAEYDIDGNLIDALEDVSQTNLVLQQSLENDACSYTSYAPGCSYMFNNRLHIGALKEYFYKGYDSLFLKGPHGDKATMESMYVMTKIRTMKGTSVVAREYKNVDLMFNNGCYELPPLLAYPDVRAYEMIIYLFHDTETFCKTFALKPHRYLNQAQYINKWSLGYKYSCTASLSGSASMSTLRDKDVVEMFSYQEGTHKLVYSKNDATWKYNGQPFPSEEFSHIRLVKNWTSLADGDTIVFVITKCDDDTCFRDICNIPFDSSWNLVSGNVDFNDVDPFEERDNVLKVSAVDNLFSFPARCTYTPSQGEIVAIASNAVALSQGQFGQHPLYLFCSDGVWAMSVDTSGATAYVASYPLSRQVCVNKESVCGIDGGVVFVGQQGVMLLSGGKMKRLSASMEGESELLRRIVSDGVIQKIGSMMQLPDVVKDENFGSFIEGASVHYLPSHDEVMFANEQFSYCYLYSFAHNAWSHVAVGIKGFVSNCPTSKMYSSNGGSCRVMEWSNMFSGDNRILLVTRPQLWGTKLPKRVAQLMLHAYSKPIDDRTQWIPSLACYMLGSNDGVNFKLVAGRECDKEMKDLKFPYYPTQSYRYYLFAVCGEMSADAWITGIEVVAEQAWNSRLG